MFPVTQWLSLGPFLPLPNNVAIWWIHQEILLLIRWAPSQSKAIWKFSRRQVHAEVCCVNLLGTSQFSQLENKTSPPQLFYSAIWGVKEWFYIANCILCLIEFILLRSKSSDTIPYSDHNGVTPLINFSNPTMSVTEGSKIYISSLFLTLICLNLKRNISF